MINAPRPDLDEAIDRVAAKMVAIDDDAGALQAAITRLPDRESRPWFLRMPVQLAAAAALVMMAFVFGRPSNERAPVEANLTVRVGFALASYPAPPERRSAPVFRFPAADSRLRQGSGGQARLPAPDSRLPTPDSRVATREDHERSLAPVAVIEAIELSEISAAAIELDAPALLEPLVLTELSLATEGDS